MENLPDKIKITCSHCHHIVQINMAELKENNCFVCSNCFSTNIVDVDKLLAGLKSLMKKVHRAEVK